MTAAARSARREGRRRRPPAWGPVTTAALAAVALACAPAHPPDRPEVAPPVDAVSAATGNLIPERLLTKRSVGYEVRPAVVLDADRPLELPVEIPCDRPLSVGIAAWSTAPDIAGARFRFELAIDGHRLPLLEIELMLPRDGTAWHDIVREASQPCGRGTLVIEGAWRRGDAAGARPRVRAMVKAADADATKLSIDDLAPVAEIMVVSHVAPIVEPAEMVAISLVDALRVDALSCYGAARPTSPHIDRLARRGTQFNHAVAAASWTRASVGSLFTSRIPYRHGAQDRDDALDTELPTLAETLRASGVATAAILTNGNVGFQRYGFYRGFDRFEFVMEGLAGIKVPGDALMPALRRFVGGIWSRRAFLYLHTVEPHAPYEPPDPFRGLWDRGTDSRIDGTLDPDHGFRTARDGAELAHVRALYDEEVMAADALVALQRAELERAVPELTMIFLSDHGESFGEHGAWEHGTNVHDVELHVPLIGVGPGFAAGRVEGRLVSLLDVAPTVASILGADVASGTFEGESLSSPTAAPRIAVQKLDGFEALAAQRGDRKAILELSPDFEEAIYDLRRDPGETNGTSLADQRALLHLLDEVVAQNRSGRRLVVRGFRPGDGLVLRGEQPLASGCIGCSIGNGERVAHVRLNHDPAVVLLASPDIRASLWRAGSMIWAGELPRVGLPLPPPGSDVARLTVELGAGPRERTASLAPLSDDEKRALEALGYLR